jgi:paraquat-inducible protein B
MSKEVNKVAIGGFVIGGIGLAILAILVFGSGKFFQKKSMHVLFFEGSVKGLNVGSPVKFRGVDIGLVKNIQLSINPDDLEFFVPVYVEIFENTISILGGEGMGEFDDDEVVDTLVSEMGLRAQLQMQSLLTGQLFINYDFYPDTPIRKVGLEEKIYEIPTIPTTLQILTETVEEIIDALRKINFEDLVDNVSQAAEGVNDLVSSSAMKDSVEKFNIIIKDLQELINKTDKLAGNFNAKIDTMANSFESTMGDTSKLLKNIDRRIDPLASGVEKTLATVTLSFTEAEALLVEAQKLISENSRLRREITVTLESISDASRSVEELSNYLQRHPESLIRGKK